MKSDLALQRVLELSRREFLSKGLSAAGWGSFAVVLATGAVETVDFFFPRVLYKPPSTIRIGTPAQFLARTGQADGYGVIFGTSAGSPRTASSSCAQATASTRFPHAACTSAAPSTGSRVWARSNAPAAGASITATARNSRARPRPLDRFQITQNLGGELVVDTSSVYGPERFESDGAFVRLCPGS